MGSGWDDNDPFKNLFGFGIPSAEPTKSPNSMADLFSAIARKPTVPPPPEDKTLSSLAGLRYLSGYRAIPESPASDDSLVSLMRSFTPPAPPSALGRISIPPQPPPSKPSPPVGGVSWAQSLVKGLLKRKAAVTLGRVLPGIDDLAIMEGRQVRAAFVYSDLHGFTKLVATQPGNKSFVFLHTFVEMATKLTKHYDGEVMDVAGDRVLSVFHRPSADLSNAPVEDAITFALQFQTIFEKVIGPAFVGDGLGQLSLGIGIDYGEAVVGCVGIRNNKRIVFFGDAANNAAKLQDMAGPS
jgi:class 3 adenylate cyclase